MRALTPKLAKRFLLAGAAGLALTAGAHAQSAPSATTSEGRAVNPDANAAAVSEADAIPPVVAASQESPEAAIVEEQIQAPGAETAHDAAVREVLDAAQDEALQNGVHVLPTKLDEAEIRPWHLWAGEDEGEGATQLRAFMAMDTDGDLLLTHTEWGAGSSAQVGFADLDINGSGEVGFAEYRVWRSLENAEAEAGAGS